MGNYNPHAPIILGNEWVPIRQGNYTPDDAITERGYVTTLDHTSPVTTGAFFVSTPPTLPVVGASELIAVYPRDLVDETGPVRSVTIPVTAVTVTGANISASVAALENSSDVSHASIAASSSGQGFSMSFDTTSYSAELTGKRILDVGLEYIAAGPTTVMANIDISMGRGAVTFNSNRFSVGLTGPVNISTVTEKQYVSFSELNVFWTSGVTASSERRTFPWRYNELALFASGATPASDKLVVSFDSFSAESNDDVVISYAALRVTYCEETRVAYGGTNVNGFNVEYSPGYNYVMLRDPSFNVGATLAPGDYAITTTHVNRLPVVTDLEAAAAAELYALRELYELPSLEGLQVNRTKVIDATFTQQYNDTIPPITLHTDAAVVTGSHSYGVRIGAPVYSGITAVQEIDMRNGPVGATSYTQVRFYARYFGENPDALVITQTSDPTATASITAFEFDELPEIIDGWKEVTLELDSPAILTAGAAVEEFEWSSTTTVGTQWQILGASLPVPHQTGAHSPEITTYLAPFGATDRLQWKSPNSATSAFDDDSDAVLMLSQEPPTIADLAVESLFQELAAVGLHCGTPNGCIPTGIGYQLVTWTPVDPLVLPDDEFGYYELQRLDGVENEWYTIMTSVFSSDSEFADYESRVGQETAYRIRVRNVLDFAGPWTTVVATLPAPGVDITGDGNSVLIFTSNHDPAGNLAYTMVWDSRPVESFTFPESETVQLQRMFGKNFMTAFRPLERGGERFQRVILVNAAAIPVPSLANFRGLRDLAWADLPYVCVRDELGNRWFATVIVPRGDVQVDRQIYLAQIDVVEVSDTPAPVELA